MIKEAAKGKRKRKDAMRILDNMDYYADKIYDLLVEGTYKPVTPEATYITEGTRPKVRVIRKVRFFDQIIHHMVVNVCMPVFKTGMYVYCCGSVPTRGTRYAKKHIERWLREDIKGTKYCVQMDIRHYFDSVDHDILIGKLARKIKDERMIELNKRIIESCPEGIPLGYYTSQWYANFLLQDLDHYIKETLQVKYYVRYLDDMVIFDCNKKKLHKARAAIAEYLKNELNLEMKANYQLFRICYKDKAGKEHGKALDFLGFRFYREKTVLRRSLLYKISRTARHIGAKKTPSFYDATKMLSYMGWIKASNSYTFYYNFVKPNINVKQLRKVVSRKSKERSTQNA